MEEKHAHFRRTLQIAISDSHVCLTGVTRKVVAAPFYVQELVDAHPAQDQEASEAVVADATLLESDTLKTYEAAAALALTQQQREPDAHHQHPSTAAPSAAAVMDAAEPAAAEPAAAETVAAELEEDAPSLPASGLPPKPHTQPQTPKQGQALPYPLPPRPHQPQTPQQQHAQQPEHPLQVVCE